MILYFLVPRVLQRISEMERKFTWWIRYLTLYSCSYVTRHLVRKEYLMLAFRSLRPVSTAVLYAHVNSTKSLDSRNTPIQISSKAFKFEFVLLILVVAYQMAIVAVVANDRIVKFKQYYELSSFFKKMPAAKEIHTYYNTRFPWSIELLVKTFCIL